MTVADRIRLKREELNLSQEELAKKIGNKDKSTISKIEKSGNDITMKNIQRIADALGVTSQYLMGWTEDTDYHTERDVVEVHDDSSEAKELYEKYKNAIPEIQNAVDSLLGNHGQDS